MTSVREEVITGLFISSLIDLQFSFCTLNSKGKESRGLRLFSDPPIMVCIKDLCFISHTTGLHRTTPYKLNLRPEMLELQTFFSETG